MSVIWISRSKGKKIKCIHTSNNTVLVTHRYTQDSELSILTSNSPLVSWHPHNFRSLPVSVTLDEIILIKVVNKRKEWLFIRGVKEFEQEIETYGQSVLIRVYRGKEGPLLHQYCLLGISNLTYKTYLHILRSILSLNTRERNTNKYEYQQIWTQCYDYRET